MLMSPPVQLRRGCSGGANILLAGKFTDFGNLSWIILSLDLILLTIIPIIRLGRATMRQRFITSLLSYSLVH